LAVFLSPFFVVVGAMFFLPLLIQVKFSVCSSHLMS
jgi:hypothetical protein